MISRPVMRPGGSPKAKGLRPSLSIRLKPGWRYDSGTGHFLSEGGKTCTLPENWPTTAEIRAKVPHLAKRASDELSEDEAVLARYYMIVLDEASHVSDLVPVVATWDCVEAVEHSPEPVLPNPVSPSSGDS